MFINDSIRTQINLCFRKTLFMFMVLEKYTAYFVCLRYFYEIIKKTTDNNVYWILILKLYSYFYLIVVY